MRSLAITTAEAYDRKRSTSFPAMHEARDRPSAVEVTPALVVRGLAHWAELVVLGDHVEIRELSHDLRSIVSTVTPLADVASVSTRPWGPLGEVAVVLEERGGLHREFVAADEHEASRARDFITALLAQG